VKQNNIASAKANSKIMIVQQTNAELADLRYSDIDWQTN